MSDSREVSWTEEQIPSGSWNPQPGRSLNSSAVVPVKSFVGHFPALIRSQQSEDVRHPHTASCKCSREISHFEMNVIARRPNESSSQYGLLSERDISEALQGTSRHAAGLRLNDVQTRLLSGMLCNTCGASGYTTTIYTPQQWIAHMAQYARREMMPFSRAEVTDEMRQPLLHVQALPSSPDYLNANGFSRASSVHRIVLSDTARQITIQPLEVTHGRVETNSAFRSATFGTAAASFLMADVERLRAMDPKSEFFVVVVGDNQNKFFKVKSKFHF